MAEKRWRVELTPGVQQEFSRIRQQEPRGHEAVDAWLRFVEHSPESGFAVPRMKGVRSRPFHTEVAAYLVVYEVGRGVVRCIGIRPVPYGAF